jgi:hypothetical protein
MRVKISKAAHSSVNASLKTVFKPNLMQSPTTKHNGSCETGIG